MQKGHILQVFVASPSDVMAERRETIESLVRVNARHSARKSHIAVQPVMWETHAAAGLGKDGQAHINPLVDQCDMLIAIFWTKVGSATPRAQSGTIEEIRRFIKKRGGESVLLFFCQRPDPSPPSKLNLKGVRALQTFAREMQSKGLYISYENLEDFSNKLQHHLDLKLGHLLRKLPKDALPQPISQERLALVSGDWIGTSIQAAARGTRGSVNKVRLSLSVHEAGVTGFAEYQGTFTGQKRQLILLVEGSFQNDRFLKMDYTSSVAGATHFGTLILEMNTLGSLLTGHFVGYGAYTERLVFGKVKLLKEHLIRSSKARHRRTK